MKISGSALLAADRVKTDGLTVSVTGASATAKGSVNLERQLIDLGLGVAASDLGKLLDEMGLPPLAKSARINAKAEGSFEDPRAGGRRRASRGSAPAGASCPSWSRIRRWSAAAAPRQAVRAGDGRPHRGHGHA